MLFCWPNVGSGAQSDILQSRFAAIRPLIDQLNNKVTRHLGASRRALFETLDKPALKSLPHEPYVYAEWRSAAPVSITMSI